MRISGLLNDFDAGESHLDVNVYRTDVLDFVVITEPHDNPGASITNAAETFCPQVAKLLGLVWKRCVFIESYPPDRYRGGIQPFDPTFDLIRFAGEPVERYLPFRGTTIPFAPLDEPGWRPLTLELARALQDAGCTMSRIVGLKADFWSKREKHRGRYRVETYDGRWYYTRGGEFAQHDITHVWGLDPANDALLKTTVGE